VISQAAVPALLLFAAAAWLAGMGLIILLGLHPGYRPSVSGLKRLLLSELAIVAWAALMLLLPQPFGWFAYGLFASRILYEAGVVWWRGPRSTATALALIAMPVVPLLALALAMASQENAAMLLLALVFVEIFDSLALLGGKLWGRTLMWPAVSPRKSWEGFAAGALGLCFAAAGIATLSSTDVSQIVLAATCTLAFAPAGDFLASIQKRLAKVKDYPVVFEGQGGLLDIYDAWLMTAPVVVLVLRSFPA
jgi:phosphatidate cytidylyltransferase